jgi:hypothetical protein
MALTACTRGSVKQIYRKLRNGIAMEMVPRRKPTVNDGFGEGNRNNILWVDFGK